ncbi:xanthine dehydrogenase small subunit [Luteipulveratus flavus]|uniref:FAD binding domain-containing protein n=1 Tax=Luteipulveratus flavus TaxID=3031728 RepID=A0ABT6C6E4_9MICO|nr:FAD binding domain-containing protein [Luteipulveratus sp. YIM 133296]MDF8262856.1 FAD binding domain-containing protein [Luteipulveratus sp. YIM 133296]
MARSDAVAVTVNGRVRPVGDVPPHTTVLHWLREIGLTGAKEGCAEGECGACSVMVARPDDGDGTRWTAINSCLVPVGSLDGQEVVTAEGLGTVDDLHPVQHEMAVRGGSQCGYCTPGFVCSMAAEYYRPDRSPAPEPDRERGPNGFDLHALSGNLCRCTGYRPIRDAAYALGPADASDPLTRRTTEPAPLAVATWQTYGDRAYVRPTDLQTALGLLADHPDAVPVAGCTDWGVEVSLRGARADLVVALDRLPELRELHVSDDAVDIGAALTLSEVGRGLAGRVPLLDELFPQFASLLIRNGATIGGNLGTGSPIGDLPPALLALDAEVVLISAAGERTVALAHYFTGYRESVRRPDELIRSVRIPLPLSEITAFHKIAKRRFDDISSVAVGLALDVQDGVVRRARIGLGGVAATPIRARATESALEGRPWTAETVRAAAEVMRTEGTPIDDQRASAAYRQAMLRTALLRLYADHAADEGRTA